MKLGRCAPFVLVAILWSDALFSAPKVSPKIRASAQKVYVEGTRQYRAGRFAEALSSFQRSYELWPSPNSHLMIARSLRDSGDLVGAFLEYERIIPEAQTALRDEPKYQLAAEAAAREQEELRHKIGFLTLRIEGAPDQLKVIVGDKEAKPETWGKPIPVNPGRLRISAVAPDRPEEKREPIAQPGEEVVVALQFGPPAEALDKRMPALTAQTPTPFPTETAASARVAPTSAPSDPPPTHPKTGAYVAAGVGVVGLATFAVFGSMTRSRYNELQSVCRLGHCPSEKADDISAGRREQVVANVGLTLGVISLGVGAFLWFTRDERPPGDEGAREAPVIVLGSRGVSLAGRF